MPKRKPARRNPSTVQANSPEAQAAMKEYIRCVKAFAVAARNLTDAWVGVEFADIEESEFGEFAKITAKEYPFTASFDEIAQAVTDWADSVVPALEQ